MPVTTGRVPSHCAAVPMTTSGRAGRLGTATSSRARGTARTLQDAPPRTRLLARTRRVLLSGAILLPDLSTAHCEVAPAVPARGTKIWQKQETTTTNQQLLGEQGSSSRPRWKYPDLTVQPLQEEESLKYTGSPWPFLGRSVRKETLLPPAQRSRGQTGPDHLAGTTSPRRAMEPCRMAQRAHQLPAWSQALLPVDLDDRLGSKPQHPTS